MLLFSSPPNLPDVDGGVTSEASERDQPTNLLVFSKTAGFRHDSIEAGVDAIRELADKHDYKLTHTEDAAAFNDDNLKQFDVIIFLSTTGDILDDEQEHAFQRFIRDGGGFVGIHAASDTEYDWPWYGDLIGAYFDSHPRIQPATIEIIDRDHPSTRHLNDEWQRTDEWYNFKQPPPERFRILAKLRESSYQGSNMNGNHPIAWCAEFDGGRMWYTGGGHTIESFSEPDFLQHIRGGIDWVAAHNSPTEKANQ